MRILLLATAVIGTSAVASTPGSWAAMHQRADRACVAMSGLARPELLATQISFTDTIGVEARMIRGTDTRGNNQRKLCLYSRRTGRAEIQDAPAWNGPTRRP